VSLAAVIRIVAEYVSAPELLCLLGCVRAGHNEALAGLECRPISNVPLWKTPGQRLETPAPVRLGQYTPAMAILAAWPTADRFAVESPISPWLSTSDPPLIHKLILPPNLCTNGFVVIPAPDAGALFLIDVAEHWFQREPIGQIAQADKVRNILRLDRQTLDLARLPCPPNDVVAHRGMVTAGQWLWMFGTPIKRLSVAPAIRAFDLCQGREWVRVTGSLPEPYTTRQTLTGLLRTRPEPTEDAFRPVAILCGGWRHEGLDTGVAVADVHVMLWCEKRREVRWKRLPSLPAARYDHCAVIFHDHLVVLGGRHNGNNFALPLVPVHTETRETTATAAATSMSAPADWKWITMPPLPITDIVQRVAAVNGQLIAVGRERFGGQRLYVLDVKPDGNLDGNLMVASVPLPLVSKFPYTDTVVFATSP
jgi:hypothetical protein